jgi:hypothetical protein
MEQSCVQCVMCPWPVYVLNTSVTFFAAAPLVNVDEPRPMSLMAYSTSLTSFIFYMRMHLFNCEVLADADVNLFMSKRACQSWHSCDNLRCSELVL